MLIKPFCIVRAFRRRRSLGEIDGDVGVFGFPTPASAANVGCWRDPGSISSFVDSCFAVDWERRGVCAAPDLARSLCTAPGIGGVVHVEIGVEADARWLLGVGGSARVAIGVEADARLLLGVGGSG